MNYIPDKVHFGLGFGYKYQYLIATMIYLIIKKKKTLIENGEVKTNIKDMIRKNLPNNFHNNPTKFFENIENLLPFDKLEYKKNCLIMLEGEPNYFEDINIFKNIGENKIIFLQIKGEDGKVKNTTEKTKKALNNLFQNINFSIHNNISFIFMTNKNVQPYFYAKNTQDKIQIAEHLLNDNFKELKTIEKSDRNKIFRTYLLNLIEENINNRTSISLVILQIDKKNLQKSLVSKINKLNDKESFIKGLNKIIKILNNLKVIDLIDYRLVILFLKNTYSYHKKLYETLYKVEMLSMDAKEIEQNNIKQKLSTIGFNADNLIFSSNDKSKYGKILE